MFTALILTQQLRALRLRRKRRCRIKNKMKKKLIKKKAIDSDEDTGRVGGYSVFGW